MWLRFPDQPETCSADRVTHGAPLRLRSHARMNLRNTSRYARYTSPQAEEYEFSFCERLASSMAGQERKDMSSGPKTLLKEEIP